MSPNPFYEVDPKLYLFGKTESPEEKIRQWAIFELLSSYGFNIKNLQIEVQCKIGSKYFPADIVVYQEQSPLIVVECKRQENENQEETLKQATSYANFLKAEFIVFTNGNLWIVKRQIQGEWYPVSDIPRKSDSEATETLTDWLIFFDRLKPILFWIHRQIPYNCAYKFLDFLQVFFAGRIHLEAFDRNLLKGTDFLLRVIAGGTDQTEVGHKVEHYELSTFRAAYGTFQKYFQKIGNVALNLEYMDLVDFRGLLATLWDGFEELVKVQNNIGIADAKLVRFDLALLQYFHSILEAGNFESVKFKDIPPHVIDEFAKLIDSVLLSKLGLRLPESLDSTDLDIFRIQTSIDWLSKEGKLP
jgi:hypothetical protein